MLISFRSVAARVLAIACSGLLLTTTVPAARAADSLDSSSQTQSSAPTATPVTTGSTPTSTSSTASTGNSTSQQTSGATPTTTATGSTSASITPTTGVTATTSTVATVTLKAGDTVYLKITPPITTSTTSSITTSPPTTTTSTVPLPSSRIFTLDKSGVLDLPYLGRFPLAGLSEQNAILRIKAEPLLESYQIDLKVLPVEKEGVEALKPFGYSLFDAPPTTFAPTEDIPVPADYVIGANDTVIIQLFGAVNETYTLVVTREGVLEIPKVGPIVVAGLTFEELKKNIGQRAAKQMIGVSSHVTLGPLRTILVFVMGDVVRPGSYTVSSLSTLTNALFASGGVTTVGSLREIQLKRRGKVITKLDFYDLLLKGDTSRDVRLHGGDVIFVPPIGRTAGVSGEVRRPAIYELREEQTVKELLILAGGMTPSAYSKGAQLERVARSGDRVQEDLDLSMEKAMRTGLRDGDVLVVPALLDKFEDIVRVSGYVKRPGSRAWFEGMKLTDVIPSTRSLLPKPDLDYAIVKRHVEGERQAKVFSVRIGEALAKPASPANIALASSDEIVVFGHEVTGDRQNKLANITTELNRQGTNANPAKLVSISGSVYEPGVYPLEEGMRVSDLIRASGNLKEDAEILTAEVSRYEDVSGKGRHISHLTVDLSNALRGDPVADLALAPRDYLVIKTMQDWGNQQTVTLSGEVRNPGTYPIARGETLSSVIKRAGGLTAIAFADGAVFTRLELQQKEEAQFKVLADRIESELKTNIVERADEEVRPQEVADIAKSLVDLLRNAKSEGRMVLDLNAILAYNAGSTRGGYNLILMKGDTLFIPQRKDEVSVVGEVRKSTTHLYAKGLTLDDYLNMSGGLTAKTKRNLVYVIRANGAAVVAQTKSGFFSLWRTSAEIRPGDTIVAMLDAEKVSSMKIWRDVVGSLTGIGSVMSGSAAVYTAIHGQKLKVESNTSQTIVAP